ncbi:hypothetical protein CDG79_28090 [Nostoc sp. 'Peltigera membranacea cyanobiont' 232]|nr:hypothetical protein CDG79_28090 [Nostoc sp. 'Peltigera membranacea cyanobiont' 232]
MLLNALFETKSVQDQSPNFSYGVLLPTSNFRLLTSGVGNLQKTLPTNYDVYRQVVKAYPQRTPLELTLGVNDNSVEKAEPVSK